jgi:glutamyl-tRNA reductase
MNLVCLSFSHKRVPIALREKLYFDENSLATALSRFRCGDARPEILLELVILSTCNRTEIYGLVTPHGSPDSKEVESVLLQFLVESKGLTADQLRPLADWFDGPEVAEHLCRVASGLESLVLGEPQILGQVGDALRFALTMNSAGAVLTKLFLGAIQAGRRARVETQIAQNSTSISTLAVETARNALGSLADKNVVIVGAGEMTELALNQLARLGTGRLMIVNRTFAAARALAARYSAEPFVFEQLNNLLVAADLLITSTGAPHTLIDESTIAALMKQRPAKPLVILDIAVPRDCDPRIRDLPNVTLCDIDDLQMASDLALSIRANEIPVVESILKQELELFFNWHRSIEIEPLIARLRQRIEGIRERELSRLRGILPELTDDAMQAITRFSQALTNKYFHEPTARLRQLDGSRDGIDFADAIRELFDLSENHLAKPLGAHKRS